MLVVIACILAATALVEARNLDMPPAAPPNGAPKGSKPKKMPLKFQIFRFVVVVGFVAIAAVMYLKRKQAPWPDLEGTPPCLNMLLYRLGVDGLAFIDVIDLDAIPANAHALILVSPQTIDEPANKHSVNSAASPANSDTIFIKQMVDGACGSLAVVHALCNMKATGGVVRTGNLSAFAHLYQRITKTSTLTDRTHAFHSSQTMHKLHHETAEAFALNTNQRQRPQRGNTGGHGGVSSGEHFVALVPRHAGTARGLIDIDSMRSGPTVVAEGGNFVSTAGPYIRRTYLKRLQPAPGSDAPFNPVLRFHVLALVPKNFK